MSLFFRALYAIGTGGWGGAPAGQAEQLKLPKVLAQSASVWQHWQARPTQSSEMTTPALYDMTAAPLDGTPHLPLACAPAKAWSYGSGPPPSGHTYTRPCARSGNVPALL